MDLNKLTAANKSRLHNTPAYAQCLEWSLADWSNAIAGETGEMCNLIKKIRRGDDIDPKEVGKELADIVIYADILASVLGLNLADCITQKFNEVSDRVKSEVKI
jgi:NTP pyrophosphatase (non-canonical NTP hydrolase)